ncbi:hypothetical protein vBSlqSZDD2_28 [Serratia phage vB_SlqS_ZDD2]|nr:hypothetical protein vBSlqSZDD2_28 [Serratia phage vB_SlqS_ZDD2]
MEVLIKKANNIRGGWEIEVTDPENPHMCAGYFAREVRQLAPFHSEEMVVISAMAERIVELQNKLTVQKVLARAKG